MKNRFFETLWLNSKQAEETEQELQQLLRSPNDSVPSLDVGNTQLAVRALEEGGFEGSVSALSLHADNVDTLTDVRGLELKAAQAEPQPVIEIDPLLPGIQAIDHVVLQTNNADDCIRLFRDDLGMRLALDQTVEKWGGRMLFFREGSLTLEIIHNFEKPIKKDRFWGICYRCARIEDTVEMLSDRGVQLSEIREGRKPGTRVATIKSHCANIPSLLIA